MGVAVETAKIGVDPELAAHHKAALEALKEVLGISKSLPFPVAATLGEDLQLEYADGMEGKNLGWGRLTKDNLFKILEIHSTYSGLLARTPSVAKAGLSLLEHVRHSLEQAASGGAVKGAMGKPGDLLLVISGHDKNLSDLAGLLGLSWALPGYQPDDTPPGGALIFSLWQDEDGRQTVRIRYVAQSLDQMRNLEAGAPESQEVAMPGCNPCTWSTFERVARSR
jgi:4-phytase/acid phosphatase